MTYRTGNVAGFPLPGVWEGEAYPAAVLDDCAFCCVGGTGCPLHPQPDARLVAVVVNGDQALATRICALLNGAHTPDVDHTRGALEALQQARLQLARLGEPITYTLALEALKRAEVELGLDGDAPSGRAISPHSASGASGVVGSGLDVPKPAEISSGDPMEGNWCGFCMIPGRLGFPAIHRLGCPTLAEDTAPSFMPRCICNDPPPTVDKPKNGTASRPDGWACPRHGAVI